MTERPGRSDSGPRKYGIWVAVGIMLLSLVYFGIVVYKGLKEQGLAEAGEGRLMSVESVTNFKSA